MYPEIKFRIEKVTIVCFSFVYPQNLDLTKNVSQNVVEDPLILRSLTNLIFSALNSADCFAGGVTLCNLQYVETESLSL